MVFLLISMPETSPLGSVQAQGTSESRYFPETRQSVKGWFWKYWQEHGGLAQQGYPISGEIQERSDIDGKVYLVQYFERAVFELHTENQPPYNVLLSLVGVSRYKEKYPAGAPNQKANSDAGTALFPQTGKKVGGAFLAYWKAAGSVAQQGYPISDEFQEKSDLDGKTYTVQYFERAVFEFHPENKPPYNVLLSQLGTFRHKAKYAQAGGVPPAPPPPPPPAQGNWAVPVSVSNSPLYDNDSSIAASQIDGSVTIGWEQQDTTTGSNYSKIANGSALAEPFRELIVHRAGFKQTGSVQLRNDSLGRKHMVWWAQSGDLVCNYYARIETNGSASVTQQVPNTCGRHMKGTALAIGPGNTAHMLFGKNNENVFYYQRADNGEWTVEAEPVTFTGIPIFLAIEVNSQGVIMATFRAAAPSPARYNDIYAAIRKGPGQWVAENISSTCCVGCPNDSKTYLPSMASDPSGSGSIRVAWSDEQCDPRAEPRLLDIYYREWLPGRGWTTPPVRIVSDPGEAYTSAMVVDNGGTSHIVYESDIGRHGDYKLFYVSGSGTNFTAPVAPFLSWNTEGKFQKSPSISYSPGYLHVSFNGAVGENKEVFYTNKQIGR